MTGRYGLHAGDYPLDERDESIAAQWNNLDPGFTDAEIARLDYDGDEAD